MTRRVRVGDALKLERRRIDVDPLKSYHQIGIRSFGKGIFHKEAVSGAALGNKRMFGIVPGDLVLNNVFAWEGAVAIASASEAGTCGSHRFLTYVARVDDVELNYLRYLFTSELGLELLRQASPGSAGRNRTLAIERFENLLIPLPTLVEQRRIVARLDAVVARASRLAELVDVATRTDQMVFESLCDEVVSAAANGRPNVRLERVATVNPRPSSVDDLVAFVPMSAVDDRLGAIVTPELKPVTDVKSGYKQFRRGDVIFARITPCMQNGKSAVMNVDGVEYGYGSTEFHVIRPSQAVLSEWLHHILRSRGFRERAAQAFTGTAGQQRVPADFLRSAEIPVPPIRAQTELIRRLDDLAGLRNELRSKREHQQRRAEALASSALNRVFSRAA